MLENFFFVGLPYIAFFLFIVGTAYRAFTGFKGRFRRRLDWTARGDYFWATRSTGFFGRASIGPAALSLHWGLFIVILAHVVGFIGGASGKAGLVEFFRWTGLFGCLLLVYGALWALIRRLAVPQVRAMSTAEDYLVLLFLLTSAGLGLYHSAIRLAFGVSYAVGPWFYSLLTFQPDAGLVASVPLVMKLHMIVNFLFFAYFPFTKLVHAFSYPFGYLARPYISMRGYMGLKR